MGTAIYAFDGLLMEYIGMCRCEGYGFQAVYSRIGFINQSVWVKNRVSFFSKLISWLKILSRLGTVVLGFVLAGNLTCFVLACEQALLFGRAKRVSRERASERRSREGQRKGQLATISHKISFVLRSDEGKYHWMKNDVPEKQT